MAKAFSLPVSLIVSLNGLTEEAEEGQVILIPQAEGNLYTVRGGESKKLLCGGKENYLKKNGTDCLYPTQTVLL